MTRNKVSTNMVIIGIFVSLLAKIEITKTTNNEHKTTDIKLGFLK